jgi:hypothetical protein
MRMPLFLSLLVVFAAESSSIPLETNFDSDTWGEVYVPFSENHVPLELKLNSQGSACILCEYSIQGAPWPEFICYAEYSGSDWFYEMVAEDQSAGCMDLTSDGRPVILAFDNNTYELNLYTLMPDSSWSTTLVDSFPDGTSAAQTSMCLDSQDLPHAAFRPMSGKLRYYHFDGTSWFIKEFGQDSSPALEVNSSDEPYLAHCGGAGVKCSWVESGQWWTMVISSSVYIYPYDICFDNFNRALVICTSLFSNYPMFYYWDAGPVWLSGGTVSNHATEPSMCAGSDDLVYVSFKEIINDDLWLATGVDSTWSIQQIAWEGDIGDNSHIAVDDSGKRFVSFGECDSLGNQFMRLMVYQEWVQIGEPQYLGVQRFVSLAVSPCPASDSFTAEYLVPVGMESSLVVYDLSGRKVRSFQVQSSGDILVQVDDLPSGLYTVVLSTGSTMASRHVSIIH